MSESNLMYGTCDDCGKCRLCCGKEWMLLQAAPFESALDMVAPCLGCSGNKNLNDIQAERGIKIIRDESGNWMEVPVQ